MAVYAVIDFIKDPALGKSWIGQREAITAAMLRFLDAPDAITIKFAVAVMNQMREIRLGGCLETQP